MPDIVEQLRDNARTRAELLAERDCLIWQARTERVTVAVIAEALGMSPIQINRIADAAWVVAPEPGARARGWYATEEEAKTAAAELGPRAVMYRKPTA